MSLPHDFQTIASALRTVGTLLQLERKAPGDAFFEHVLVSLSRDLEILEKMLAQDLAHEQAETQAKEESPGASV